MNRAARRFAIGGGAIAAVAALVAAVPVVAADLPTPWGAAGWGLASAAGLLGGAGLAASHGKPGSGFLVALGTTTGARFVSLVVGLLLARRAGGGAVAAFLCGFGTAYVALTAFEWFWFTKAARSAESRG